jgi:hypothetical protein
MMMGTSLFGQVGVQVSSQRTILLRTQQSTSALAKIVAHRLVPSTLAVSEPKLQSKAQIN